MDTALPLPTVNFVKRNNLQFLFYKIKMPTKPPTHYFRYVTNAAEAMKYFLNCCLVSNCVRKKEVT